MEDFGIFNFYIDLGLKGTHPENLLVLSIMIVSLHF